VSIIFPERGGGCLGIFLWILFAVRFFCANIVSVVFSTGGGILSGELYTGRNVLGKKAIYLKNFTGGEEVLA